MGVVPETSSIKNSTFLSGGSLSNCYGNTSGKTFMASTTSKHLSLELVTNTDAKKAPHPFPIKILALTVDMIMAFHWSLWTSITQDSELGWYIITHLLWQSNRT